jgi:hypothetical protein
MTSRDLLSPFPPAECVRRLREKIGWGSAVAGHVGERGFRLHKTIWYRNSFQTYVKGSMLDEQGGTRIHCRFGVHPFVIAFMIIWLGFAAFAGLMMLVNGQGAGVAGLTLFPVFGGAVYLIGRAIASSEEEFLTNYLQNLLDARAS